jgi:uncharacterized repeat protein (TIGR03803 family)
MRSKRLCMAARVVAGCVMAVFAAQSAQAQTYKVLYSFKGSPDGANPSYGAGVMIRDSRGNLYGTTYVGGVSNVGTVFRLSKTGNETVLYSFTEGADGAYPSGGMIRDAKGNLYGTTLEGGTSRQGTVFKVNKRGKETVLYSFCSQSSCTDGANPAAGVMWDSKGNLYGTTVSGGAYNFGTVFQLDASGAETVLYSFKGEPDGAYPYWGVIRDTQGNFYGTTSYGGINGVDCSGAEAGCGTVFKLSKTGRETVLYSFRGLSDGGTPNGGVIGDAKGNLYGTTYYGGTCFACGVVFELSKNGKETVLHSFDGKDGADPIGDLIPADTPDSFYGTTYGDQGVGHGTIFKVRKTGKVTVLHSFKGGLDGDHPTGGVIVALGNLYGTTRYGGDPKCDCGVVFEVFQ